MKYPHVYALFLVFVFHTSCGQNQTKGKKIIITSENNGVITAHRPQSITRNLIQDRKGNIWIAAFDGIFRYDGKSLYNKKPTLTEIKSKYEGSKGMLCGMLEANDGSILYGSFFGVYRYDGKTITDFKSKK